MAKPNPSIGEGLDTVIAGLKEGDTVAFEYNEKAVEGDATAKQLTLTKIQKQRLQQIAVKTEVPVNKQAGNARKLKLLSLPLKEKGKADSNIGKRRGIFTVCV